MDVAIIYLAIAFILLILSAVKDTRKAKQALKATGKIALTVFPRAFPGIRLDGHSISVPPDGDEWLGFNEMKRGYNT